MNDFLLKMMIVIKNSLGIIQAPDISDMVTDKVYTDDGGGGSPSSGLSGGGSTTGDNTVTSLSGAAETAVKLIKKILGPVLAVIGVAAVVFVIVLGVKYAKAEDADARKKVQGRLIGALIGAVIIIVGATLCFALDWAKIFYNFSGVSVG